MSMVGFNISVLTLLCVLCLITHSCSNDNKTDDKDKNQTIVVDIKDDKQNAGEPVGQTRIENKGKKIKNRNKNEKILERQHKKKTKEKGSKKTKKGYTRIGSCTGTTSHWSCCSVSSPCQKYEGDCDRNSECAGSLVCGKDNCKKINPLAHSAADCCVGCEGTSSDWNCCSSTSPCRETDGDCDSDSECAGSLVCGYNNCRNFNPSADALADCCIKSNPTGHIMYLTSSNYPNHYSNNQNTKQMLSVPKGHFIQVTFLDFQIEAHSSCRYDYIQFCDGNGKCMDKMCGINIPQDFIIETSTATVLLHTDGSVRLKGFRLSYQAGSYAAITIADLDVENAFKVLQLTSEERLQVMEALDVSIKIFQGTEKKISLARSKTPFIQWTELTNRLGGEARLSKIMKDAILKVSENWSSESKGAGLVQHLSRVFQKSADEGGNLIESAKYGLRNLRQVEPNCLLNDEYRRIDGKCNNIANNQQGSAGSPLKRFMANSYQDGKSVPRGGMNPSNLPNARKVSLNIHHVKNTSPLNTKGYSHLVMQFGQFLDHDIVLTAQEELDCCNTLDSSNSDVCFNIDVSDDPFYKSHSTKCHSFTRSDEIETSSYIREQMNGNTAFIDASNVYGSDDSSSKRLRTMVDGKLKIHANGPMPPTRKQCGFAFNDESVFAEDFVAGDERSLEQPTLTSIHTLFIIEHNRIATKLKDAFSSFLSGKIPEEQDEILYQESRKLVGAQMQNIVYNEFLPIVLGDTEFKKYNLELTDVTQYDDSIDPSIRNEFATVAFRFGHSLIAGIFNGNGRWSLSNHYFDKTSIFVQGTAWQNELEEASKQSCPADDLVCTMAVTNFLFANVARGNPKSFGDDLPARNIQRGRDHGIPSYNAFRVFCGLSQLTSFNTRPSEITVDNWNKIKNVYEETGDIESVDAFTGGLAETTPGDGLVGPTFACIIGKQFSALKLGDRYFFNNQNGKNDNARGLKKGSLKTVRKRTLRDIMCENTGIDKLTKSAMKLEDNTKNNPELRCTQEVNHLDFKAIASDISGPVYFIAGGSRASRDISVYHPTVDNVACSILPPTLNNDWKLHTTFYHDNTICMCGGYYDTASTCISHNKDTEGWKTHTLTTSRYWGHSSVVLHNRVYFIGGVDSSNNNVGAESTPLPLTDTPVLTPQHNLDYKGEYPCTARIDEDTLVVTGGRYGGGYLRTVATYNVRTRKYTQLPSLKQPRHLHGCGVLERGNNKWIIVAGGYNNDDGNLQSTEMLQLGGSGWTSLGNLNVARRGHSMAVTQRGVMVMVGYGGGSYHSSVELLDWDSAGKTWSVVQPSLNKVRGFFGGAVEIPASMFGCTV